MELTGFGEIDGTELLQKLPLFSRLTFDETTKLARIMRHVDAPAGRVLIEQNSLGNALYVVREGEVSVTRDADPDGRHERAEEVGHLGVGELFGEMSLVDDLLTSARVTAATDVKLLELPRGAFEELLASDEKLALKVYRSFCRTLSDRLRRANATLAARHTLTTTVR